MKIVDLKTTKQIPQKYHYLIDWNQTYSISGVEKDSQGYWLYIKEEYVDEGGQSALHEPLSDMAWYLGKMHEEVQEKGKHSLSW